jgi:hypothetical protein
MKIRPVAEKAMAALPLREAPPIISFVATAKVFELTLLTADEALRQSRAVRMLAN